MTQDLRTTDENRLWKAIESYRSAGGMAEHWARRDHLAAEIDTLLDERGKLKVAAQAGLDALLHDEDKFGAITQLREALGDSHIKHLQRTLPSDKIKVDDAGNVSVGRVK